MTGIVDVGGGLRGIYGAGVFDGLLDMGIEFKCCVGISAGSANAISYIAKQRGRNYRFFHDYVFRKEYMSLNQLVKTGSYINFDYIYGTLSNSDGEDPLDMDEIEKYDGVLKVLATDATDGSAKFFDLNDIEKDKYGIFSASCCIPCVNRPVKIDGIPYVDGGVAIPVPVDYCFNELGLDRLVVVLTLPKYYRKTNGIDAKLGPVFMHKCPEIAYMLRTRADRYNRQVEKCIKLEKEGKVLIVAPDDTCGISTLSKTEEGLDALYRKGIKDSEAIRTFLENE